MFAEADVTAASRKRFLTRWKQIFERSQAIQAHAQQRWPAAVLDFMRALPGPVERDRLSFAEQNFHYEVHAEPGHCLVWVPDAEGLRQLGLDVPHYQPVARTSAAKMLKVSEKLIYIGPMVIPAATQGLCPAASP